MANIEVVYAPLNQKLLQADVPYVAGMTVQQAIDASGFSNVEEMPVGIFSHQVTRDTLLKPGDRVEIYRPLLIDPMEKRRQRAKKTEKR